MLAEVVCLSILCTAPFQFKDEAVNNELPRFVFKKEKPLKQRLKKYELKWEQWVYPHTFVAVKMKKSDHIRIKVTYFY